MARLNVFLSLIEVSSLRGLLGRVECSAWCSEAPQIQLRLLIEASQRVLTILLQRIRLVIKEV
jgi:hypothetical protein